MVDKLDEDSNENKMIKKAKVSERKAGLKQQQLLQVECHQREFTTSPLITHGRMLGPLPTAVDHQCWVEENSWSSRDAVASKWWDLSSPVVRWSIYRCNISFVEEVVFPRRKRPKDI